MEKLKTLRKDIGYTQKEVAERLHMATSTYQTYEQGACEPNIDTLISMSHLFKVSVDEIIGNNFEKQLEPETQELRHLVTLLNKDYTVQTIFYVKSLLQYQNNIKR